MKLPSYLRVFTRFRPGKLLTLFFIVFFILFNFLGTWQLNRAAEKTQLAIEANKSARQFSSDMPLEPYVSYRIAGTFITEPIFYMDNRTVNGQAGYEVWAFFDTEQGRWLISTGWLAGQESRDSLPKVNLNERFMAVEIMVRPDSINPLYGVEENKAHDDVGRVWLVQSLTSAWLEDNWPDKKLLGIAQMKDSELYGVGPGVWQPSVMSVEKHQSYALQWYGMSLALLGMFLYAGFATKNNNK